MTAFWIAYVTIALMGLAAAAHAVMHTRTAQGALAWVLGLLAVPFLAVPLYLVFGSHRFVGLLAARGARSAATEGIREHLKAQFAPAQSGRLTQLHTAEVLSGLPFTSGNQCDILIDGEQTFAALFAEMDRARHYILIQFYIIRDDALGERLKQHALRCLERNVRVYILVDAIGSLGLNERYFSDLREAGARVERFVSSRSWLGRLQINFRNHRKVMVVDGHTAFVGGHNVGDEYLGQNATLSPWRDTHLRLQGPAGLACQCAFVEDWFWATLETEELDWKPRRSALNQSALIVPSGPADHQESCTLLFIHLFNSARERLWLASPYFVPNSSVMDALRLAALRGVDVRVLLPKQADSRWVQLAGHAYASDMIHAGIGVYRYASGFMHQKCVLIDDDVAVVTTANMDNRSLRLNFEISALVVDEQVAARTCEMLTRDFECSTVVDEPALQRQSWALRAASRGARLVSPIL